MSCGVPRSVPAEEKLPSCCWIRQPETAEKVGRAIQTAKGRSLTSLAKGAKRFGMTAGGDERIHHPF